MTLFSAPGDPWSHRTRIVLAEKSIGIDVVDVRLRRADRSGLHAADIGVMRARRDIADVAMPSVRGAPALRRLGPGHKFAP